MVLSDALAARSQQSCELCAQPGSSLTAYPVPPYQDALPDHQVALCPTCLDTLAHPEAAADHLQCLTGSIWSEVPAVQALSHKLLRRLPNEPWAAEALESVELDEAVLNWSEAEDRAKGDVVVHTDAYGAVLQAGDTVVLIQNLNVKGANFIAPKGTQVRKIRLVPDNGGQIEGKINGDTIVILTQYVKKG
ncbi:MAG: PhnA protein [Sphingobacteriales bacterium]|nr:MAG: PhnA protein [Sphingobacteriales bacterium]